MDGRIRLSFHARVMLVLFTLCLALVGTSMLFQHHREKKFRHELFNTKLQTYNSRIIEALASGETAAEAVASIGAPFPDLRVTVVGDSGRVIYDNNDRTPFPATNHNDRPEIIKARESGAGYSVERRSVSDRTDYFYSARLGSDGMVVRSAAPYTHSLRDFLAADSTFLWVMLGMTMVVCTAGYFLTRRISTSIRRLNIFAEKAKDGERIYDDWAFPGDELGEIASNIVRLYVQRDRGYQAAIRQEQEKIRLKKQLTNNINHELKTPVAAIKVCAELLRDHPDLAPDRRDEFTGRICDNVVRLERLLHDVSSITRMDDGAGMISKERVDLRALVEEVAEDARIHTDMSVVTDMPPVEIYGNKALLESLFRNLIDNAIAYSGGSEIRIAADNDGNFTVRDNGTGIPEAHMPHIFERFYRVDSGRSRQKGGTGLGLSIVRNAVAIHGGTINASNDGGLRFDFRLSINL